MYRMHFTNFEKGTVTEFTIETNKNLEFLKEVARGLWSKRSGNRRVLFYDISKEKEELIDKHEAW